MAVYQAIRVIRVSKVLLYLLSYGQELFGLRVLIKGNRNGIVFGEDKVKRNGRGNLRRTGSFLAGLSVCLWSAFSIAAETTINQLDSGRQNMMIFPLHNEPVPAGLGFDLGGSGTRKLELQLSGPLTLNINNSLQKTSSGIGSVFLDSSVNFSLSENVDITASLGAGKSQSTFQPLGSIHCQNGVLEQGSYRASDCYFINQANVLKQDQVAMGLRYGNEHFNSSISMFQRETSLRRQNVGNVANPLGGVLMGADLLTPAQSNPLMPNFSVGQPLNYLQAETTGLDMEFQVGLTMDRAGEVRLGLQLTRVLDASYDAGYAYSAGAPNGVYNWTIASPVDSARLGLDWNRGNFSGGIQGFYREQVEFLNRDSLDSVTTFDVHFTWRAPWNANLSIGTTNVLNAGNEDNNNDNRLQDPFESVYGRIPYVRYQQDL